MSSAPTNERFSLGTWKNEVNLNATNSVVHDDSCGKVNWIKMVVLRAYSKHWQEVGDVAPGGLPQHFSRKRIARQWVLMRMWPTQQKPDPPSCTAMCRTEYPSKYCTSYIWSKVHASSMKLSTSSPVMMSKSLWQRQLNVQYRHITVSKLFFQSGFSFSQWWRKFPLTIAVFVKDIISVCWIWLKSLYQNLLFVICLFLLFVPLFLR